AGHAVPRGSRELGVHAVVADVHRPATDFRGARGLIISAGPASVTQPRSPSVDRAIYELGVPILGICYGHQLLARDLAGRVEPGTTKEYGHSSLHAGEGRLFRGLPARQFTVWMSHGDTVVDVPPGFVITGETDDCKVAAMEHAGRQLFGLQFHPEVVHTEHGTEIYRTFVFDVCGCREDWDPRARVDQVVADIRRAAGDRKVFFLISGGVDSTVAFSLCARALGPERVLGLYVDTGFMREGDAEAMQYLTTALGARTVRRVDRSADFFGRLRGVLHPEDERPIPGAGLAVRCLGAQARAPVESLEPTTIPLPAGAEGWIVPVRTVGVQGDERSYSRLLAVAGLGEAEAAGAFARRVTNEHRTINRVAAVIFQRADAAFGRLAVHPAALTPQRIAVLRAADDLVTRLVRARGLYDAIWQMPVAMLPLGSGPGRETIVLRPVNSRDGMTADFARLPA